MVAQLPEEYQNCYIGRIVERTINGKKIRGEVQGTEECCWYLNEHRVDYSYQVKWEGKEKHELLSEEEVKMLVLDRFVDKLYLPPALTALQEAGWESSLVDHDAINEIAILQDALAEPGILQHLEFEATGLHYWFQNRAVDEYCGDWGVEFGAPMEDSQAAGIWEVTSARMMLACVASNTKSIKEEDYKGPPVYNFGDFTPVEKARVLSIALRRVVFFEMRINLLAEIKDVKAELRKLEEGPPLPTARKEPATKKCAKKKQQEDDAPTTPEEIQERIGMLEEDLVEMEQELQQVETYCNKYADLVEDLEVNLLGWRLPYTTALLYNSKSGVNRVEVKRQRKAAAAKKKEPAMVDVIGDMDAEVDDDELDEAFLNQVLAEEEDDEGEEEDILPPGLQLRVPMRIGEELELPGPSDARPASADAAAAAADAPAPAPKPTAARQSKRGHAAVKKPKDAPKRAPAARPRLFRRKAAAPAPAPADHTASEPASSVDPKPEAAAAAAAAAESPSTAEPVQKCLKRKPACQKARQAAVNGAAEAAALEHSAVLSMATAEQDSDFEDSPVKAAKEVFTRDDMTIYPDGRSYPSQLCCKEGDMPLAEWTALEASGGADDKEYVVEAIVDERGRGRKKEVVVKWAGFELHPDQWWPYANFEDCAAIELWEAKRKDSQKRRKLT